MADYRAVETSLAELLDSWLLILRYERKSEHTMRCYRTAVTGYLDHCEARGLPAELTADGIVDYLASRGGQASTTRLHLTCLKLFAKWLEAEEGFDAAPVTRIRLPKTDEKTIPHLSGSELDRLIKACDGTDLADKRDKALVVMFAETGLRAAEMLALDVGDVDVNMCSVHVRRGKGGKGRRARFSLGAAATLDRWLRARKRAVLRPAEGPLWVSHRGNRLTYTGLARALRERANIAGVEGFHVHRLRHTSAVRWLAAGGSETGLMQQHGWASRTMIDRYVKSASEVLASDEFDRLGLSVVDL